MKTLRAALSFCMLFILVFATARTEPARNRETRPGDAATYATNANELLQHAATPKEFQDVAWQLEAAVAADPSNLDNQMTLGWVYMEKLHEPRKAYPHLALVAKNRPDNVDARKLFGMACSQTGRLQQAVTEFTQASMLQPDDLWIRANLARSLARLGHYREAERLYAQILATDPHNFEARMGQAELAAWRGHTKKPLETLGELKQENSTNADVLTLSGDIHRWNWDISEARQDYQQALTVVTNDYDARTGLAEANRMAASEITLKGYDFVDTAHFHRDSVGLDTRLHLADRAYLLAGASGWRFTSPGFSGVKRLDGQAGLEYHWSRWLETTAEGTGFAYEHQKAHFGGQASLKLSPTPRVDFYASGNLEQPFTSSIATVTNGFKQNSAGGGFDIRFPGRLSVQDGIQVAHISDGNTWWEEKPQLSFRVFDKPATYIRAQYDYINYAQTRTNYWTPAHRSTLGPVLDISIPLGAILRIDLNGQAPYVFDAHRFGYITSGGPTFEFGRWVELSAAYLYASIPADPSATQTPPWSGHGGQAHLRFRF